MYQTWKLAVFEPARFYPAVGNTRDTTSAVLFFLITGVVSVIMLSPLQLLMGAVTLPFYWATFPHSAGPGAVFMLGSVVFKLFTLVFTPVILCVLLFFAAGLTHFFLLLVRGAPRGFSATLGTFAYASAANVFPLIGWIWSGIVLMYGLALAHGTETWRPAAAVLLQGVFLALLALIPSVLIANWFYNLFLRPSGPAL